MKEVILHTKLEQEIIVTDAMLASHVGSGIVDVYATPIMIALMEQCACTCLQQFLDEGETSVGVMMNTSHDAATPSGMKVHVVAEITQVDRKKVSFSIQCRDEVDVIGNAQHDRFVVKKEQFEAKAKAKAA